MKYSKYLLVTFACLCMLSMLSLPESHGYSVVEDKFEPSKGNSSSAGEQKYDIQFFDELFDPAKSAPYKLQVASHGMKVEYSETALLNALSKAHGLYGKSKTNGGGSFNLSGYFANWNVGDNLDVTEIALDPTMKLRESAELYARNSHMNLPTSNSSPAPVPEPATLLLLGSALSGMALWARKRKR